MFTKLKYKFSYSIPFFLLIVTFFIYIPYTFAQWEWQNPLPQGNSLYSIQYIDENLIWACGNSGILLKSTDSGENWEVVMLPKRIYAQDIFFINAEVGWVCGKGENVGPNYIFNTTDRGATWEMQLEEPTGSFRTLVFVNENKGWAAGNYTDIWHTTNGGFSWEVQSEIDYNVLSLFLLDSLNIWATTEGGSRPTLKTNDGGANWVQDSLIAWALDVQFLDSLIGWASGWHRISKTTNGGKSWEEQYYKTQEQWKDIFMLNANYGWVVSSLGLIVATSNSGQEWIEQNNPTSRKSLDGIAFKDSSNGFLVGGFGTLLNTTNGGENWLNLEQSISEEQLFGLYFINEKTGWVSGSNGTILKTTNSGQAWKIQNSGVTNTLVSMYFIDDLEGWVVGDEGTILKTTNAGVNWNIIFSPTTSYVNDIDFNNYPVGWLVAGDGLTPGQLFKSTDGGNSWNIDTSILLSPGSYEIQFTSNNVGWLMSVNFSNGTPGLYRTEDGGDNWDIKLLNSPDTSFYTMHFINDLVGWLSPFASYTIFRTTDGGISWDRFPTPALFKSIYFIDSLNGWSGSSLGEVYRTTNGGKNWEPQHSPMSSPINKIIFYGENFGWAVGFPGNIIHTSNGGVTFVNYPNNDTYPTNFLLSQNYPNPFNPSTIIRYEIPGRARNDNALVSLKVYDVLGNEIAKLVNEEKPAGSYGVEFNGTGLSSGVYFYRLNVRTSAGSARHYVETRKMVLIK